MKAQEALARLPEPFDPAETKHRDVLVILGVDPQEVLDGPKPELTTPSGTGRSFPTSS